MEIIPLKATPRKEVGRKNAKTIRREKSIPAVLYGADIQTEHIRIDKLDFAKILASKTGEHSFVNLQFKKSKDYDAVIKEIQYNPVSEDVLHIDFEHIPPGKEIEFYIGLEFLGTPHGVTEGGVFSSQIWEVPIRALPREIPDVIEIDISELDVDEAIHIKDIKLEKGTILLDDEMTVASVVPPSEIIEEEEEEEEIELGMIEGEEGEMEAKEGEEAERAAAKDDERAE